MTATTLALLNPLQSSFKTSFSPSVMDGSDIDYQSIMPNAMDQTSNDNLNMNHRSRPNLSLEMPPQDSLQTPECLGDGRERSFFTYLSSTGLTPNDYLPTPSFGGPSLPTPTIEALMRESMGTPGTQHPLANVAKSEPQMDLPETVQELQNYHQQQQQQQQQPHQHPQHVHHPIHSHHHTHTHHPQQTTHTHQHQPQQTLLHEMTNDTTANYNLMNDMNSTMSPDNSSNSNSSNSFSHDDHSGGDYSAASPRSIRMSSGNHYDQSRRKSGRPTKKQQYDQMVQRKKNMEAENSKLRKKAEDYETACKRLREKLLTLIQPNNQQVVQVI